MRYAARPAMAESRLISYEKKSKTVSWYYNGHKTEDRIDVPEPAIELLKKMIIHIPDEGFRCVRYYGFYNNKKKKQLDRIYELIVLRRNAQEINAEENRSGKKSFASYVFAPLYVIHSTGISCYVNAGSS